MRYSNPTWRRQRHRQDSQIRTGEKWPEFGYIMEVKEGNFANVGNLIFKTKMGSNLTPRVITGGDRGRLWPRKETEKIGELNW